MIIECPSCGTKNRVPADRVKETAHCGRCKADIVVDHPVHVLSAEDFDETVRASPVPVLVDFWAPWCGPCRMVAPELDKLAKKRAGEVLVLKVNTDDVGALAGRFGIQGIPTFIRFDGGSETSRASGAMKMDRLEQTFSL